jgi:dipeptide/tripeptide permease
MAARARRLGLGVMVGTMVGTSLATGARASCSASICEIVDLDGRPSWRRTAPRHRIPGRRRLGRRRGMGRGRAASRHEHRPRASPTPAWFGQPRGLTVLFLTNMWEQFSYFGMRALLVYYMTKQLLIAQGTSSLIYGTYTACAYFTPIIGGVIADRLLGKRRAIIIGASVMAAGHFMMGSSLLYVALATIALGNGLFLPTLPSQINDLYAEGDPRRGWAYNVYYLGINIGGFLAPLLCGTLGELFGWHVGFAVAGSACWRAW